MTKIRCDLKHASNGTNQLIPMMCFPLGFKDIAEYVISKGLKVDEIALDGSTPRDLASEHSKSFVFSLFFTMSLLKCVFVNKGTR